MKKYSIDQIEAEADLLATYDGNPPMIYTGQDDDLLHFEGTVQNFAGERNANKQFKFTVANAATVTRTAVIWPGYLKGNSTLAPGQLADGAFNDTAGNSGLTGTSNSLKTIAELFAFLERVPTRMWAISIRTTVEAQMSNNFTVKAKSPFDDDVTTQIRPADNQDQTNFQLKILQFFTPENFQLDYETLITYPFVASSSTTLTLYFGASLNIARSLKVKAQKANTGMAAFGGHGAVIKQSLQSNARRLGM